MSLIEPYLLMMETALAAPLQPFLPVEQLRQHQAFAHLAKPDDRFDAFMESQAYRKAFIRTYGFSMVSSESLQTLASLVAGGRVLDVGAGSGYLSHALAGAGVDVYASDLGPPGGYGAHGRPTYRRDHEGDVLQLSLNRFGTLLMAWPSPWLSEAILPLMVSGQRLIYLGEGRGGNAGSDAFFAELATRRWRLEVEDSRALNRHHLQFAGIHDHWQVFTRLEV